MKRCFQTSDLLFAAGNNLARIGVVFNLGVEIIDEPTKKRRHQIVNRLHAGGIFVGPADVSLQLLIALKGRQGMTPSGIVWLAYKKKPADPPVVDHRVILNCRPPPIASVSHRA
jgi:hypothetical protein